MLSNILAMIIAIVVVLLVVFALSLAAAYPLMLLVNYLFSKELLTFVFGSALTFWKAFWLNIFWGLVAASVKPSKDKK